MSTATEAAAGSGAARVDPLALANRADPYPGYAAARDTGAVLPVRPGLHALTRHADCADVLADRWWSHAGEPALLHPQEAGDDLPASFLWMDPPDHTRLRALVATAFTPQRVTALGPRIRHLVDDLLAPVAGAGPVDVVPALSYPLPLTVICELLGVPPSDHEVVRRAAPALARGFDPDPVLTPDERGARTGAARDLLGYFGELVARRRARPADDLVSELVAARDAGALTAGELLATCVTLVVAGHETSVNLVSNALLWLARLPDQYALLRARPDLVDAAVEEVLRFDSPVQLTTRMASGERRVAGRTFGDGEGVVVVIGSANRDPAAFPEPDRFDPTRYRPGAIARRPLSFGRGLHYCLGAGLARLEARLLLTAVTARVRRIGMDGQPGYKPNIVLRGPDRLVLRLE